MKKVMDDVYTLTKTEKLFIKFIKYIGDTEGTDFISNGKCISEVEFTDEEWAYLEIMARMAGDE